MAQVQMFNKTDEWLDEYKQKITQAINLALDNDLMEQKYADAILTQVQNQDTYVPRDDVDSFLENIQIMINNPSLAKGFNNVKQNLNTDRPDIEVAYEYISIIHGMVQDYNALMAKKQKQLDQEQKIQNMRRTEEKERQQNLDELEQRLNDL